MQNNSFQLHRFMKRSIMNAWHSLLRNKLLTIATVFIIALMIFVFNLILALSFASDSIIENVGEKLDISAEMKEDAGSQQIEALIKTLQSNPKVKEVVFISKEEALQSFGGKYPNVISFLDHNKLNNPLPDTIRIVTQDIADNNEIIDFLEEPQFSSIVNQEKLIKNLEQKERNEKILAITTMIHRVSFWLIIVFAVVGIMIIFNSINIKIHNHEKEVQIMKLVGAKYSFIRGGFVLEGMIFALAALFISLIFSRLIIAYLAHNLVSIIDNETLMAGLNAILIHFEDNFWLTLGWQFLAILIAGFISSYLAIELYLRKKHAF